MSIQFFNIYCLADSCFKKMFYSKAHGKISKHFFFFVKYWFIRQNFLPPPQKAFLPLPLILVLENFPTPAQSNTKPCRGHVLTNSDDPLISRQKNRHCKRLYLWYSHNLSYEKKAEISKSMTDIYNLNWEVKQENKILIRINSKHYLPIYFAWPSRLPTPRKVRGLELHT